MLSRLDLICVDCDWGVGIIRKAKSQTFPYSHTLDYNFLEKNRKNLLNLISVKSFIAKF